MCVCVCVRACVRARARVRACVRACVCVCVSMPAGVAQQSSGAVSKSRWPGLPSLISLMVPVDVK